MVHLVKKKFGNKIYLYLEHRSRIDGKSKRVWSKYLGPEDQILESANLSWNADLEVSNYDFGLPVALMQIAEKLDLIKIIDQETGKRKQGLSVGQYILIAALNRCIKPVSKRKIRAWFNTAYLEKFFPEIDTYLDSMAYTNHFAYLNEINIENIEMEINKKLISEYQVDLSQLVYDATNFYTYINPDDEDAIPRHGHSKENRTTLNLVGLALLCTQDGTIPLLCDIYPGNVHDSQEFKWQIPKIIERSKSFTKDLGSLLLSFDKGNHSDDAFAVIDRAGMNFIVSVRPSMVKQYASVPCDAFKMINLPNKKRAGILEYTAPFYGQNRRLIVVYNPEQAKWNGENLTKKLENEVAAVKEFFETRLNVKKWRDIEAVRKKLNALIPNEDHRKLLTIKLKESSGKISLFAAVNIKKLSAHVKTLGKSYLISNHPSKTAEELVWLFRQQSTIEKAFHYLKSPDLLHARPIFHRKDESIRGHLFSCVIGLLLLTLLLREVRKTYSDMSLFSMSEALDATKVSVINHSGSKKPIKILSTMPEESMKLVELLNLNSLL